MPAQVSTTTTITVPNGRMPLGELVDALAAHADRHANPQVSISSYVGDQRDPGYATITITDGR